MAGLLEVQDVAVAFGGVRALDDVTLEVPEGQIVGLIGPNGAGKTTLFNVITGLQRPLSGRVIYDGRDITDLPPHRRARLGIGRSFQNLGLIKDETVRVNLMAAQYLGAGYPTTDAFFRPWRWRSAEARMTSRAEEAAAAFGLSGRLERRIEDLSFGQSRFAELACVMVERPRLMLLDEPTTGLDIRATARLRDALADLRKQGETVLVVAHNVRFVMGLCDIVYVLAQGRVIASGAPDEVRSDELVSAVYLGSGTHGQH